MIVEVLGCDGGPGPGRWPMSLLVDEHLLIDAGSVASTLSSERCHTIRDVIITHAHLDHIRDLAFLPFGRTLEKHGVLNIWGSEPCLEGIRTCVFNPLVWIDFAHPDDLAEATIAYRALTPEEPVTIGGIEIEAVPVAHSKNCLGLILRKGPTIVVFTADSGPTNRLWERAREKGAVSAVFADVSFPSRLDFQATNAGHGTPRLLMAELEKLRPFTPRVFACHIKPDYYETVVDELQEHHPRVTIPVSGDVFDL